MKRDYVQFLREYESLGQMELVPKNEIHKPYNELFYLPHHPVIKEASSTTRLRVVFDASAKSRNGQSLNDNLPVGPTIQENLFNILLRFRKHKYVISADIEKMFRQIVISEPHTDYQRILWRESPDTEIKHYRLSTVTYGTATAPFLATYALQLLAEKYEEIFPVASSVLKSDFYMDDLISGADTLEEALSLQKNLIALLKKGNFRLRKWSGNHPALLNNIAVEERELSSWNITDGTRMISVLGIKYDPIKDFFYFKIDLPEVTKFTKRSFLSETSRIYDPMGFLSPVTVGLKILYQKLWIAGIGWDDNLTPELQQSWLQIRNNLDQLSGIKFPRWLYTSHNVVELHCFADASKDAYAAVVYARTTDNGIVKTNIIAAKTRVAPIKIVSVPKLELCGATLVTRLLRLIIESIKLKEKPIIYYYTDSSITLNWLSKPPKVWETYIANRTSEILTFTNRSQWFHVKSSQNPADLATRGLYPQDLINNDLWFNGPEFLLKQSYEPPPQQFKATLEPDIEVLVQHSTIKKPSSELLLTLINRFSNFRTITNVLAYIIRFIKQLRKTVSVKKVGIAISVSEFQEAQYFIFRVMQAESYGKEIKQLKNNLPLLNKSNLISFHPFLNGNELLRVGGRLSHADISYDAKHPIVLPMKHPITEMIVREMHHKQLHAGLQLMISTIRQRFQIPRVKNLIRQIIHRCFVCRRHKGQQQSQLMGQLPECRVSRQVKPFVQVGTDLAGPFILKTNRNRGAKTYKAYLVIFICMATKALSLEIVSDLSTITFIAALKRFFAVRGYCADIFCDNGTNFVGASKEIRDLYNAFISEVDLNNIQAWCTDKQIKFHFIPPAAPSFGGLWEAAVKSCKFHIKRVLGETRLTYEEFLTLIKQIEALLNSRPIGDLSLDSYDPLTPGHFLITQPFTALPEPDLTPLKINTLTRWQLTQQMYQGFWNRWSKEYLTSLNKFQKWHSLNPNIKTGDLVLISNQNLPPSKWPLARITTEHAGEDGVVRVVTLKLPNGTIMKRPVNKLCFLPPLHTMD